MPSNITQEDFIAAAEANIAATGQDEGTVQRQSDLVNSWGDPIGMLKSFMEEHLSPTPQTPKTEQDNAVEGALEALGTKTPKPIKKNPDFTGAQEESFSRLFGPVTKEGYTAKADKRKAPNTEDRGFFPDFTGLLPPIVAGVNVFGLSKEDMIRSGIDPDLSEDKRPLDYNPQFLPDIILDKMTKIEKERLIKEDLSMKEVVFALMEAGHTPENFESGVKFIRDNAFMTKDKTEEQAFYDYFLDLLVMVNIGSSELSDEKKI